MSSGSRTNGVGEMTGTSRPRPAATSWPNRWRRRKARHCSSPAARSGRGTYIRLARAREAWRAARSGRYQGDHRRLDPGRDVALQVLAAFLGRAVHDQVVDELVGDRLQGAFAVSGCPLLEQRRDHLTPPEPLVEGRINRHGQVRRDHAPPDLADIGLVLGRQHEDPGHDVLHAATGRRRALGHVTEDGGYVVHREPVQDHAVALASGETEHAGPQRRHQQRRHLRGRASEPESFDLERLVRLGDLLARQRGRRKRNVSRTR